MKVAIFTNTCPIQNALINKIISKGINIDTIFISKNIIPSKKRKISYIFNRLLRVPFELPFRISWEKLRSHYKKRYPNTPKNCNVIEVDNINNEIVIQYIKTQKPSLIIVSATTMVKDRIIEEAEKINCMILNLHTGVSPYIKGGPNCTNWCLALDYYLIGNTIMKLDKGIDSGAIITTECTKLDGDESLYDLHYKVFEHGFNLYIRVINCLIEKKKVPNIILQDNITKEGKLFYTKDWTITQVIKAYYNFLFNYKKGIKVFNKKDIILFPFKCERDKDEK